MKRRTFIAAIVSAAVAKLLPSKSPVRAGVPHDPVPMGLQPGPGTWLAAPPATLKLEKNADITGPDADGHYRVRWTFRYDANGRFDRTDEFWSAARERDWCVQTMNSKEIAEWDFPRGG